MSHSHCRGPYVSPGRSAQDLESDQLTGRARRKDKKSRREHRRHQNDPVAAKIGQCAVKPIPQMIDHRLRTADQYHAQNLSRQAEIQPAHLPGRKPPPQSGTFPTLIAASTAINPARLNHAVVQPHPRPPRMPPNDIDHRPSETPMKAAPSKSATISAKRAASGQPRPIAAPPTLHRPR